MLRSEASIAKMVGGFSSESLLKVQMYVDPEFPALERSIGSSTVNVPDLKKVMWKRPREVASNSAELVVYDKEKLNSCDIL
jgi:calpain-15